MTKADKELTHEGKLYRNSADGVMKIVNEKGSIKLSTLLDLTALLRKIDRPFHVEIAVHPTEKIPLMKTIDNEEDARQTIFNIKDSLTKKEKSS